MNEIEITSKTKNQAAVKLQAAIAIYMFEQQYGELKEASELDKKRLMMAQKALNNIIKLGRKQ